jgi:glutaredoxin
MRPKDGFTERAIFVIDGEGIIRYIDIHAIDDQPDNEEVRKVLREIEGKEIDSPATAEIAQAQPVDTRAPVKEIILYCAKWCRDCVKVKTWLEQHGLAFVEVDVDYELEARKQVREWCGGKLITPVIDFYGTIIIDYDVARLEEALGKRVE